MSTSNQLLFLDPYDKWNDYWPKSDGCHVTYLGFNLVQKNNSKFVTIYAEQQTHQSNNLTQYKQRIVVYMDMFETTHNFTVK